MEAMSAGGVAPCVRSAHKEGEENHRCKRVWAFAFGRGARPQGQRRGFCAPHLEQLVSFVEDQPEDSLEGDLPVVDEAGEAERVGDENVKRREVAPAAGLGSGRRGE